MSGLRGLGFLALAHGLSVGLATGQAASLRASLNGAALPPAAGQHIVVDQDIDQADMAVVTVEGPDGRTLADRIRIGDDMSVAAEPATAPAWVFTGEVVAIEPGCDAKNGRVAILARNRLHRLAGVPRTRAFFDVTDAEIVRALAAEHGLVAAPAAGLEERHDAVYQHNQTDLEFLRERAASLGYEVWAEDTRLILGRPRAGGTIRPETFHARLSSSMTVRKEVVRGWDPQRRLEITGQATSPALILGEARAPDTALGATEEFTVDHPIFSVEEASAIAKATLEERASAHVSAEAEIVGAVSLRAGQLVTVEGSGDAFNGKYLVQGVSHRYTHSADDSTGYRTLLRVSRTDGGLFFIPEIDDEVLVAFEHGDLRRPYVVRSLWDDGDACSTDRPPPD